MTTFNERGALSSVSFTPRAIDTGAHSERAALDTTYFIPKGDTQTDTTAPVISDIHANAIYATSAEIDWNTDEEANCQVYYGTAGQTTVFSLMTVGAKHEHYVTGDRSYILDVLPSDTVIYFFVVSADRYGNSRTAVYYSFRTVGASPGVAPTKV